MARPCLHSLLRKSQFPLLAIAKICGKDPQEGVLFLSARASTALSSCQQGTAPKENPEERSEEHTSELQSHHELVCRLLLEKKNNNQAPAPGVQRSWDPSRRPPLRSAAGT